MYLNRVSICCFQEYTGPMDTSVCGNSTRKSSSFNEATKQALQRVVTDAPNNQGYAHANVAVSRAVNESSYVLANCWRTLDPSSCRACLENASASVRGCLPWSEGRTLNTGCFLRYSDQDFLNKSPAKASNKGNDITPMFYRMYRFVTSLLVYGPVLIWHCWRYAGTIIVIVVSVVSVIVVLAVGATIGFFIWKQKYIQKKRKGKEFIAVEMQKMKTSTPMLGKCPKFNTLSSTNRNHNEPESGKCAHSLESHCSFHVHGLKLWASDDWYYHGISPTVSWIFPLSSNHSN